MNLTVERYCTSEMEIFGIGVVTSQGVDGTGGVEIG